MEVFIENIIIYGLIGLILFAVFFLYIRKIKKQALIIDEKIKTAKEEGLYEPVSLHPFVDKNSCIQTGACIQACPEHDILGIRNGVATCINTSHCVGHGACFHACPTEAITLLIGTEKRGVDLPHVNQYFESNVKGISIAGEIGGMGLIKNAVEQGRQAVDFMTKGLVTNNCYDCDLVIVGAGPAGISATLQAKKLGFKTLTLEQDSLGGTVYTFPRAKIVMTSAMDLPLHGKVKLFETSKQELLDLWNQVLGKNEIEIHERKKVEQILKVEGGFNVVLKSGEVFRTQKVLLAIGRRGTPRKLNVPGEESTKVAYRLLEPELIQNKNIVVVGGGDSAIESAMLLADENKVTLSYRKDNFARLKPKNAVKIKEAIENKKLDVLFNSNLMSIEEKIVKIKIDGNPEIIDLDNDQMFIFAGGELPTQFLENAGIKITKKFGDAILKHEKPVKNVKVK